MRLFLGLEMPEAIRKQLRSLCGGIPGARWTHWQDYHITLHFLGELAEHEANEADFALARLEMPAFPLRLTGIDRFFSKRRTRTIWAGVQGGTDLATLHIAIGSALRRAGVASDSKRFVPHVTMARLSRSPEERPEERIARFLAENALFATDTFIVTHFTLFSSHRAQADEPHYHPHMHYTLTGTSENRLSSCLHRS